MDALEDGISGLFDDTQNSNLSQMYSDPQPGDSLDNNGFQESGINAPMAEDQEKDLSQENADALSDIDHNNNLLQDAPSDFLQKTKHHGPWCRFKKSVRRGLRHIRRCI